MAARKPLGGFQTPLYNSPEFAVPGLPKRPVTNLGANSFKAQNPYMNSSGQPNLAGIGAVTAGLQGLQSGAANVPTADTAEAVTGAVSSGLVGAGSGFLTGAAMGGAGGVPGAIIGGVIGLASGGLNAWLGLRAVRRQRREQAKKEAEIAAKNEAREKQARADALGQLGFNRRTAAIQSQWAAQEMARGKFFELLQLDNNLRSAFVQQGL